MRNLPVSEEKRDRIQTWLFILVMKLYGQNIYNDDSYVWKVFELDSLEEIDMFFEAILNDFKYKKRQTSKLYRSLQKNEDILSR